MALGKQAKLLTPWQESLVLHHLLMTRHPKRDRAMYLLGIKNRIGAQQITPVTGSMVTDADGTIDTEIALENTASKGTYGGRAVSVHQTVREALIALLSVRGFKAKPRARVVYSERGSGMSAAGVANRFVRRYATPGMQGCSSHSGRRPFVTNAARNFVQAGHNLRNIQKIARHRDLSTTQRTIEGGSDAKRRVVDMV